MSGHDDRSTSVTDDSVLAARGFVKSFGEGEARTEVLHGVDLAVEPGEWVAVMGPSGCGKSTLRHGGYRGVTVPHEV